MIVYAEIANTPAKQIQGLSFREKLGEQEGMLFVFPRATIREFWIKDMRFPLDVIWINEDTVVGISPDVPIPSGSVIPRMNSGVPSQYVLEVHAGFASRYNIQAGDRLDIRLGS